MELDIAKLREVFFQDAEEHLESIDVALADLSSVDDPAEPINALFRSIHSLKGDSGAVGFTKVAELLHRFETYLDMLRSGDAKLGDDDVGSFSTVVECLEQLLNAARDDQPVPAGLAEALQIIDSLESSQGEQQSSAPEDPGYGFFDDEPSESAAEQPEELREYSATGRSDDERCFFGEFLIERGLVTAADLQVALDKQQAGQTRIGAVLMNSGALSIKQIEQVLSRQDVGRQADDDELFGQIALEMGLIDGVALETALEEQKQTRPGLRKTFLDLGMLDRKTVQKSFKEFLDGANDSPDSSEEKQQEAEQEAARAIESEATPAGADFDCDPQLLGEFISDSDEHLTTAEEQLLVIERDPGNAESLNAIYRSFHTVKGLASFLGLDETRNLAHEAESMLNLARDGKLVLSGDAFEVALLSVDGLRRQVRFAEDWMRDGGRLGVDDQLPALLASIEAIANGTTPAAITPTPVAKPEPAPSETTAPAAEKSNRGAAASHIKETIKVDRDRLDKLINVIGELVIGQAMVEQEIAEWQMETGNESTAVSQLNKTVRDLQELSLSLRMVPVGSVFHKMARIVRDLGRKLGKEIHFRTEGDDTELDKTVVDQIGDPLLHMVRNAADHGIESKEDRIAAGKPAHGTVVLRAYHQGGNIYLEITDDGKGLDSAVLLKKAIERGIVSESDSLSEQEIHNLIFAPGFSTAKQVTDVSGRGVGMDVVRRNVEALQGSVSITSVKGEGSTITIRLPLTLAILDGLSIRLRDDIFIVPILSVVDSFCPAPGDLKKVAGNGEVVVVRGEVVPLLRLDRLLGYVAPDEQSSCSDPLVVIVEDRGKKYALLVDELLGQSQVVIKNLEANYTKVEGLAGATILGDGRVAMILDVFGLVSLAGKPPIDSSNQRTELASVDRETDKAN